MMIEFPLASLSIEEKLLMMETLWDDLCHQAEGIASPSWHEDTLAQREAGIMQGREQFLDWEDAKQAIRAQLP